MPDISDMAVFVKIVECSSLTRAGRELRMTPGAVTKRLNKLEARLGVRLLNRTTRQVSTTEAGSHYYDKALAILGEINWLENSLSTLSNNPRGLLKITAPGLFGRIQLCPLVLEFRDRFPEIQVHLQLTDRIVDLIGEGFDLAIRNSRLTDSNLVARKLAADRRVVCGAPSYFEKFGRPAKPADLLDHECLLLRFPGSKQYRWHFREDGQNTSLLVKGSIDSNSTEVLHEWTLSGAGMSMRSTAEISDDLRAGRLEAALTQFIPDDRAFNLVYPKREMLPQKVRVFIDFLFNRIGKQPHWDAGLGF